MPAPIYFAVDAASVELTADDRVLADAVAAGGGEVVPVVWGAPVPPGATLIVRSTWDYVEAPARFLAWLATLDADHVDVHNGTSLLRWNVHKRYLLDLARRGLPVVPTVVLPRGTDADLTAVIDANGWEDAVVKPAIGGTARLARHVGDDADAAQSHLDRLLGSEDALVQQFVPRVLSSGETSVVAIAGLVTHAVRKTAAPGEWRVQTEFGGRVDAIAVDDDLATVARGVLATVHPTPRYARIDLVETGGGEQQVMELELVEPELFFRLAPHAAHRLAAILLGRTPRGLSIRRRSVR